MNAMGFARKVIEGTGGMDDFERYEIVSWKCSDRVAAAHWMLKCLANPDCEGSQEALDAIIKARKEKEA